MGNKVPKEPFKELPIKDGAAYKICIYTVATPEINQYSRYSIPIIQKWCEKHGYDFKIVEKSLDPELPINFTKIIAGMMLLANNDYDYIMHIDADAPVVNQDYDIRNLIRTYAHVSCMFSEDCYSASDCSMPGKQNSGVFIIKNDLMGKGLLKDWYDSAKHGACKHLVNTFPNCQLVLWNCVVPRYRLFIKTLPYNVLNGVDGLLVNHLMLHSDANRSRIIGKLYQELVENEPVGIYY